jgi:HEAT repeat protein
MSDEMKTMRDSCREQTERARRDPRSTHQIITEVLSEVDEDRAWEHVVTLHFRSTPDVLEATEELCSSECAEERSLAANILGQLGVPDRAFPEECHRLLAGMLDRETDADVLAAIGIACGHLHHPGAVPLLTPLRRHPEGKVRHAVVHGLMGHEEPQAVAALIELSADADEDIRDWATFALGTQLNLDTPQIREALARRLSDPDGVTCAEVITGLVQRDDPRAFPALLAALEEGPARFDPRFDRVVSAACDLADPHLLAALLRCRERGWDEASLLEEAIPSCGGEV